MACSPACAGRRTEVRLHSKAVQVQENSHRILTWNLKSIVGDRSDRDGHVQLEVEMGFQAPQNTELAERGRGALRHSGPSGRLRTGSMRAESGVTGGSKPEDKDVKVTLQRDAR